MYLPLVWMCVKQPHLSVSILSFKYPKQLSVSKIKDLLEVNIAIILMAYMGILVLFAGNPQ